MATSTLLWRMAAVSRVRGRREEKLEKLEERVLDCRVVEKSDQRVVLLIEGELVDQEPIVVLEDALEEQYVDDGVRRIALDLTNLRALDLEGVGMLLRLRQEAERQGKRLAVTNPSGQVREKLRTTGVLQFLEND